MSTQATQPLTLAEMALERHCPLVTCGNTVKRGQCVATANAPGRGDIHTPIAGKVVHVDAYRVRVEAEGDEAVDTIPLNGLSGQKLRDALLLLGADLPDSVQTDTLIINGVDAEQGIVSRQTLLASHAETLVRGINALESAYSPGKRILAVPHGSGAGLAELPTKAISIQYPSGLDPLVAKEVTGREAPKNTVVIGLETLFHVGRIMVTGLPVLETVITVGESGKVVALGTPAGEILDGEGVTIKANDRIVMGGIMRGKAAASPTQGVDRATNAVTVVSNPDPVAQDAPCVGCGECIRHCPARLDPAMITSYAEFGMFDKAAADHVDACFECGLCGFFCIAQRPMLQYIRLAKHEIALVAAISGEES